MKTTRLSHQIPQSFRRHTHPALHHQNLLKNPINDNTIPYLQVESVEKHSSGGTCEEKGDGDTFNHFWQKVRLFVKFILMHEPHYWKTKTVITIYAGRDIQLHWNLLANITSSRISPMPAEGLPGIIESWFFFIYLFYLFFLSGNVNISLCSPNQSTVYQHSALCGGHWNNAAGDVMYSSSNRVILRSTPPRTIAARCWITWKRLFAYQRWRRLLQAEPGVHPVSSLRCVLWVPRGGAKCNSPVLWRGAVSQYAGIALLNDH